jgi:hypothetical protein
MSRRTFSGAAFSACLCALIVGPGCGGKTSNTGAGRNGDQTSSSGAGSSSGQASSSGSGSGAGSSSGSGSSDMNGHLGSANIGPSLTLKTAKKVDLLFDIDNSSSMGDKQAYLASAIPDLVRRLVTPNCVDSAGNPTGQVSDANGHCTTGTVEYPPVTDMHIGVITSSLGARLGNQCPPDATQTTPQGSVPRHNDDQAHLINRGSDPENLANYAESPLPDLGTANYLNWFPSVPANAGRAPSPGAPAIGDPAQLVKDFSSLVVGTHAFGCGVESQLESWYRFLVQPDPYASLSLTKGGGSQVAEWTGIDTTILAQRAAFLRPDSLVAVVVLSDENDSEVDVRSFGGSAWNFMVSPGFNPPRGASICETNPADPSCTSCAFGKNQSDSQCMTTNGAYTDAHDWGYDLNLRHVHEQQKYGVSVQFPIERYVGGLASSTVPDRNGEYPSGASAYQGLVASNQTCTNPLFAAKLPTPPANVDPAKWQPTADEVCHLTPGTRSRSSVYYMHIGGVPHQLLQQDPSNPDSPQKTDLAAADWTLILGKDPLNYDYTGIDPHMVESYKPRTAVPIPPGGFPVADPTTPEGMDPISGREWTTNSSMAEHRGVLVDVEYACTFKLASPRDCSDAATLADPTLNDSCDCQPPNPNTGSFTADEVPAVCNNVTPTQQDYAKAYPTVREIQLAKLLGDVSGANPGVVSSICPIHNTELTPGDPLYGYRPAIDALIDRCLGR